MVKVNVSGDSEAPTMEAQSMAPSWNGNAVPIVTARTFRAYVSAERQNDPNGEWYGVTTETIDGETAHLTYVRPSDFPDEGDRWQACDVDPTTGEPLYALDGWTWAEVTEGEYVPACPACGELIDYCQGHGEIGDPDGAAILAAHDDGDHSRCDPAGCTDSTL